MISRAHRVYLLVAAALLAAACGSMNNAARVTVHYKQIANFPDYRLAPDSNDSHGAGDGMFILYKVTAIDNTGSAATSYDFDPNKVLTVTKDKTSNETVSGNILLGSQNVTTVTVPAGQSKVVNACFIKQALTANPQSIVAAQVPLLHQVNTNQPVSMTNVAPNGGVAAVGNALPATLQSLCSSN